MLKKDKTMTIKKSFPNKNFKINFPNDVNFEVDIENDDFYSLNRK